VGRVREPSRLVASTALPSSLPSIRRP
jgi:hypothetical protein